MSIQDPKYDFAGPIHHRDGNYDLSADEPVMLLRGKDPDVPLAIANYVIGCLAAREDPNAIEHAASAAERLAVILAWQRDHPSRVRRGCHQCP